MQPVFDGALVGVGWPSLLRQLPSGKLEPLVPSADSVSSSVKWLTAVGVAVRIIWLSESSTYHVQLG